MALRVDMTGNSTGFTRMLDQAKLSAKIFSRDVSNQISTSFSDSFKGAILGLAGYMSLGAITSGLRAFIDTGKQISDVSDQMQMSTDAYQKWSDAVQRAGLSGEGFQRVVEALRQKRTDALTDPKARGELTRLGFSDKDITGDMDMSEFTKRALANANGSDLQRGYLADVIGDRGVKYGAALNQLPKAQALYSPEDIKDAAAAADALKALGKAAGSAGIAILENLTGNKKETARTGAFWSAFFNTNFSLKDGLRAGISDWWHKVNSAATTAANSADYFNSGYRPVKAARHIAGVQYSSPIGPQLSTDPMDAKLADQRDQMALQDQERQQRMEDSQRELMTIGDRRKSIMAEMPGLESQIAARQKALSTPEGFLTDKQKNDLAGVTGKARTFAVNDLREKFEDITATLQERLNKDKGDLKQEPLSFNGDSMAKVGLYSASALQFSPLLGLQQQTNRILERIASNTARPGGHTPNDPHRP